MNDIKQVIIVRTKYPDPDKEGQFKKVRTGKLIDQACHGSMAFLTRQLQNSGAISLSAVEKEWIDSIFAKVCVQVETEQELKDLQTKAEMAGLTAHLVIDSGLTEFRGVPTVTCLVIGPDFSEKIDPIAKDLKLY